MVTISRTRNTILLFIIYLYKKAEWHIRKEKNKKITERGARHATPTIHKLIFSRLPTIHELGGHFPWNGTYLALSLRQDVQTTQHLRTGEETDGNKEMETEHLRTHLPDGKGSLNGWFMDVVAKRERQ